MCGCAVVPHSAEWVADLHHLDHTGAAGPASNRALCGTRAAAPTHMIRLLLCVPTYCIPPIIRGLWAAVGVPCQGHSTVWVAAFAAHRTTRLPGQPPTQCQICHDAELVKRMPTNPNTNEVLQPLHSHTSPDPFLLTLSLIRIFFTPRSDPLPSLTAGACGQVYGCAMVSRSTL